MATGSQKSLYFKRLCYHTYHVLNNQHTRSLVVSATNVAGYTVAQDPQGLVLHGGHQHTGCWHCTTESSHVDAHP